MTTPDPTTPQTQAELREKAISLIFHDLRGRKVLKWLVPESADRDPHPIGYVEGPIDCETQRECVEKWVDLTLSVIAPLLEERDAAADLRMSLHSANREIIEKSELINKMAADWNYERTRALAAEQALTERDARLATVTRPITWQDIRLRAGEGKLKPEHVLAAANAELRARAFLERGKGG